MEGTQLLDTLVYGGHVVRPPSIQPLNIGIKDGTVSFLGETHLSVEANQKIDATGLVILPGCVDVHVHPRDPGQSHKETFSNLTQAAAVGGITTIFCQPNLANPVKTSRRLLEVAEYWAASSWVDFAIQALPDPNNVHEIKQMIGAGAISIEFITPETRSSGFIELLRAVHEEGGVSGISCTDWEYANQIKAKSLQQGLTAADQWLMAYPSEREAATLAKTLSETDGMPFQLHFHMLSTTQSADILRSAKRKRAALISAETAPRYLMLNRSQHLKERARSTVIPPLRTGRDNAGLWSAIYDETVDLISSDHAPHAQCEKETDTNVWQSAPGLAEIELSLPLMLNAVTSKFLDLCKLVNLMSERPARRYGIYPKKGAIQIGSDADLVFVDLNKRQPIANSNLCTAGKYTLFDGWSLQGWPVKTLLRGTTVAENLSPVGPAMGQWVRKR
jgi:dihydroorotase (multifunctional complex type)